MPKTTIKVTQDELEALKRYQARKKKKEEAMERLQKLKTTQWEVPSLEEVVIKHHLDTWGNEPRKEDIDGFIAEAQQLIDFANTMFSEEAIKNHDDIVKKFRRKGWTVQQKTQTLDGYFVLYNYFTIKEPDFRVMSAQPGEYQYTHHYKVAKDRVIISTGLHPQLVIKTAFKRTMLINGAWSAIVKNNSIKYEFNCIDTSTLAALLGEKEQGDRPVFSTLQFNCWGTITKQNFDLVMTDKQIASYYKKWYLTQTENLLSESRKKLQRVELTHQLISDADFTKILETYRKEE